MTDHTHTNESGDRAVCSGGPDFDLYASFKTNIERCGRAIVGVVDDLPFAYTIGNSLTGAPELLIFGPSPGMAEWLLNTLSADHASELSDGALVSLGGAYPLKVVSVGAEARSEYAIQAGEYLGNQDYPIMQVLVPDKQGRFPGDPECSEPFGAVPVLKED